MAVVCLVAPAVHAAPPEAMTFQGYLVDGNGNPLATNNPANYPVIFRIYAASSGGVSLWSEQQIVTVDKGNFSVILSEGTAVQGDPPRPLLSAVMGTNGADRYIQLSVTISGSTLDMLPRMRLLPSPFAFLSTSANQLVNPNGAAVVTYANSRVEVNGSINVNAPGTISGNGSGLTGLTASQIPNVDASKITSGTLSDARLSANVALQTDNNAFVGNQTISGNLGLGPGTPTTTFPLTMGNTLGDKISLFGGSGNTYAFGVQPGLFQMHTADAASDIAFGYGSSAAMTENMRITGDGFVGIGTNNPTARLEVNGSIKVDGANVLEFGANVAGKEPNAGKIGYGTFTADTLDIVGAGTGANRKVKVFAEGGTDFSGPISFNGEKPFHFQRFNIPAGAISINTGWSTTNYTACVVGFRALDGDILEDGVVDPIQVYATRGGGLWYIVADFATHGTPPERWEIQVLRISNGLVTSSSTTF